MGMGNLHNNEDYSAPLAEINTTPLVDVMLVLLVIFLVTAPMLNQAIKLELPDEKAAMMPDEKAVVISVTADGRYYWDEEPLTRAALGSRLAEAAQRNARQPLHLRADKAVAYERVSHILAAAQRVGLNNVGFITEER